MRREHSQPNKRSEDVRRAELVFDPRRVGRSRSGLVWGGLHVRLGKRRFPSKHWTDSAVVVLGWWLEALTDIVSGKANRVDVPFMEGPYSVRIRARAKRTWSLELIERRRQDEAIDAFVILPDPLLDSVVAAAGTALSLVRERRWKSADSARADVALARLQRTRAARAS